MKAYHAHKKSCILYRMRFSYTGGIVLSYKGTGFTYITDCSILHPEKTLKIDDFYDISFQHVCITCFITILCILNPIHLNNYW